MAENERRAIEKFLFKDMGDEEREKFEERLIDDDDLFVEVAEAENEMADRYVRGMLPTAERLHFENALARNPSLAAKAANARALMQHIDAVRIGQDSATAPRASFFERLSALFSFASPTYALGGLLIAFAVGLAFLAVENSRRGAEVARLEAQIADSREAGLQRELAASEQRVEELRSQVDESRTVSGDLTADLARERDNARKLKAEINELRKRTETPPTATGTEPPAVIAVTLPPAIGQEDAPQINIQGTTQRVSILLDLPASIDKGERLSVRLNGREIARDLPVRTDRGGRNTLPVTLAESQLASGDNTIAAFDARGKQVGEYKLTADKKN